jgi:type VI secretion system secreted protein VgrG
LVSGKVQLSDYQFKQPSLVQSAQDQFLWDHDYAEQEIYEWQQGDFLSADEGGQNKAKSRVEGLYQHGYRAEGQGKLKGLQTGYRFNLDNHPNSESNRGWLVLGTQITIQDISQEKADNQFYDSNVRFLAQPDEQILRPDLTRNKPQGRPQTATVVGPAGEEIYTDQYGRVKVKFHWDRLGVQAQDEGADTGDGTNTCWLRVSTAWAGNHFGTIHLPRIGQEVIVDFFNGDPDMPFVSGRLTNPEQMPVWELPSQKALSGIKSKELGGSQANQLVMDDSKGQVQVHLRSDHQASELNLGYITRIPDPKGRKDFRGEGFELRTDGHGVIRSNKGIFVTAYGRANADKTILEMDETIKQLQEALEVAKNLNKAAKTAKHIETKISNEETQTTQLNLLKKAGILQSAPNGIASTTPENQILHAGQNTHIVSEIDTNISSNSNITMHAGDSVGLFANSKGAKLFANQGKVEIQAQHDELLMNALKDVEVTSTEGKISIFAKEEILISCGGAYIKLKGGLIEMGSAQPIKVKADMNIEASNTINMQMPSWPKTLLDKALKIKTTQSPHSDDPYVGMPFTLFADGAEIKKGITDETGYIRVEHKEETKQYKLVYASGDEIMMNMVEEFEEKGEHSELSNKGFRPIEYKGMDVSADEWAEQYAKFVDGDGEEKGEE